jgi:predicted 3-demethylubiquinone-9 3-methyltransferase (glyoxalase superfamily)
VDATDNNRIAAAADPPGARFTPAAAARQEEPIMAKVTQHLWFARDMQQAVRFYTALIPGSRMGEVHTMPAESPAGPPGSVEIVDFTLGDQRYMAIEAGPLDAFNHSFSILIECEDQAEIDRLWDALREDGSVEQCGWLRDRWGLSWQIVPALLGRLMASPDRAKAARVAEAMLKMVKLDIAGLQRAADGTAG